MNIEITIDGDVDQDAAGAIVAGLAECARLDAAAGELARLRDAYWAAEDAANHHDATAEQTAAWLEARAAFYVASGVAL